MLFKVRDKGKTKAKTWFFSTSFFSLLVIFFMLLLLWLCSWFLFIFGYFHIVLFTLVLLFALGLTLVLFPFGINVALSMFVYYFSPRSIALLTLFWCFSRVVLLFFACWWWCSSHIGATIFLALVLPFFSH